MTKTNGLVKPLPLFRDVINMSDNKFYYSYAFDCDNCKYVNKLYIRKGTRAKGLNRNCEYCGCEVKL